MMSTQASKLFFWSMEIVALCIIGCKGNSPVLSTVTPGRVTARTVTAPTVVARDPAIAAYISSIPKLNPISPAPPHANGPAGPDQDLGIIGRRRHICNAAPMSEALTLAEIVALDPNAGTVWPGALFRGSSLAGGRLTPISLPRTSGTVTVINLTRTGTGGQLFTRPVSSPSFETTQEIVQSLTSDAGNLARDQPADIALSISKVHSFEQALLDAGVSATWLTGSASASLRTAASRKHNGLIVRFVQRYYSLKFGDPPSVVSFLDPSVTLDQVKAVAFPAGTGNGLSNNPPMYISEVKFGRMLLIAISSDEDASSLEAAVRAEINSGVSGGVVQVDASTKRILQNSEIEGLVVGGSSAVAGRLLSSIIGGNIDGLPAFINEGATYNPNTSPGAPISYTARYLDGSLADSSYTADFSLTGCREEDVAITVGRISFQVGNDDKDDEMFPFITIQQGGTVVADANGRDVWDGAGHRKWDDHEFHGPFTFPVRGLTLANCSNLLATIGQRSTRGTNPGWRTTAKIELLVNGSWFTTKPMSDNADEFIWGDNHPGQSSFGLVCPQ
jgi:hypothetical protein